MTSPEPLDLESLKVNKEEACNWPRSHRTERHDQAGQSLSAISTTEVKSSKNGRETCKGKTQEVRHKGWWGIPFCMLLMFYYH